MSAAGSAVLTGARALRANGRGRKPDGDADSRRFREAFELLPDCVVLVDGDGRVESINQAGVKLFGAFAATVRGQPREALLTPPEAAGDRWHGHGADGRRFLADVRENLVQLDGRPITVLFVRDASAEEKSEQVDAVIRCMTQRVLEGQPLEQIAPWLCSRIVESLGLVSAWMGTREADGSIHVVGGSPEVVDAIRAYGPRWDEQRTGLGPTGDAVRTGRTVLAHVDSWPHIPALDEPRRLGYRLIVSIPLLARQEVVGVLSALTTAETLSDDTLRRLDHIGDRLGVALRVALDQSRLRLQGAAMSAAANAIFITDRDGRIEWVNEAFTRLTGFPVNEVIGQTPRLLKSGAQDASFYEQLWGTLREPGVWRGELTERRRDGTLYIVDQTVTPILDADGHVSHFVVVHEDVTARKRAEERIRYLSNYDPLTALPNRQMFQQRLADAMERGRDLAVLLLDLVDFSRINDALGHDVGDRLLVAVVDRLNLVTRHSEALARVGGDEFGVIQLSVNGEAAETLANRLLSVLTDPFMIDEHELQVVASVGIALHPGDGETAEQLLKNAETAMYRAVRDGGSLRFFATDMTAETQARLATERDLRRAASRNELVLHYQPQFDVLTGRVVGLEALVRWQHPTRGLIYPGDFIPLAEENGLILPIGEWVLREACRQIAAWRGAGVEVVPVAVNLSAVQLRQAGLRDWVRDCLAECGVAPELLEIELTESAVMEDAELAEQVLKSLRALGIRLAIDDFGTGYSSLSYLKRFSLDRLKIDRSFVRDLSVDPNDAAIARAIITLGHSLGLVVVSEGVEHEDQLAYLRAQGCDVVQGYLFSRPVPAVEIPPLLQERGRRAAGA